MRCSAVSIPFGSAARRAETHKNAARTWIRKIIALMLPMLMVPLSAALRHNCDLNIAGLADYLLYNCFPEPFPPGACRTSYVVPIEMPTQLIAYVAHAVGQPRSAATPMPKAES